MLHGATQGLLYRHPDLPDSQEGVQRLEAQLQSLTRDMDIAMETLRGRLFGIRVVSKDQLGNVGTKDLEHE